VPGRAEQIVSSGANILAIGVGGAVFLAMTAQPALGADISFSEQTQIYAPDGSVPVLSSPYWVVDPGPGTFEFCQTPEDHIALFVSKSEKPAELELYGQLSSVDERWPLVGFTLVRGSKPVKHYFWGYAGDPYVLTGQAADCLSNMIYHLYGGSGAVIPATTSRRGF
jgi:hypothetical protein